MNTQIDKNQKQISITKFFKVAFQGQTYLNLFYLSLAFPLGLFYFILLVLGFSLGFGLLILWIGAIILAVVFAAWPACAAFERKLAVWLLHEDIPNIKRSTPSNQKIWDQIKANLSNPVTWKSLAYLLAKFPLGISTFVVLVTLITLTLGLLTAPLFYHLVSIEILHVGNMVIHIDTMSKAIGCSFLGLVVFFSTLHIFNGLAWVSGRFAKVMLS